MKIVVQPQNQGGDCLWQVRLEPHCVSFRSEEEGRQFAVKLAPSVRAPHNLPDWPAQLKAG